MLKKIAPLALVAALGLGSAAQALTDTGTVASVNEVRDTITLTDGATFSFSDEGYAERLKSFKPGDQVSVSWHHVGTAMEATSISPVNVQYVGETPAGIADHGKDHLD